MELGPVRIDAPRSTEALWVVDGQQRITALTGTLLHPAPDYSRPSDDFEFYFDLSRADFIRRARRQIPSPWWLPMSEVIDSAKLLAWIRAHEKDINKSQETLAIEVSKAFREYEISAVIVESDSDDVLREIFERTNTAGRRLNQDEVFHALFAARPGEAPQGLDEIANALNDLRFGDAHQLPLRQSVFAVRGVDPTRAIKEIDVKAEQWRGAMAATSTALRQTIVFLKRDVRVPNVELLPYGRSILPLVRFFHRFPEPRPRSRELLSRWLWRTWITGQFWGEIPQIRRAVKAVNDVDEERAVQALLSMAPVRAPAPRSLSKFDLRTAETRLLALALVGARPVNLASGAPFDIEHHLLVEGRSSWKRIWGYLDISERFDSTAPVLYLFHPGTDVTDLRQLIEDSALSHPEWLSTHLFSQQAIAALVRQEWESALQARATRMGEITRDYLTARARWGETDRPSLAAIVSEASENE